MSFESMLINAFSILRSGPSALEISAIIAKSVLPIVLVTIATKRKDSVNITTPIISWMGLLKGNSATVR